MNAREVIDVIWRVRRREGLVDRVGSRVEVMNEDMVKNGFICEGKVYFEVALGTYYVFAWWKTGFPRF